MNRGLVLSLVVAALIALGFGISCVYTVSQTQQVALVEFGKPVGIITGPGLHFKSPLQRANYFDRRLLDLDAQNEDILTLDHRHVVVDAFARWRIVNPFLFQAQPDFNILVDNLKSALVSDLREVLGNQNYAVMLSGRRAALMGQIRSRMNADTKQFGVEIVDVRLRHVGLPGDAADAVYQRMAKELERQAALYRAEGDAVALEKKARADREAADIRAQATAEASLIKGEGDAAKTKLLADAANKDPNFYAFWRSLQAYQETFAGSPATIVLSPKSDFLKYFADGPGVSGGRRK